MEFQQLFLEFHYPELKQFTLQFLTLTASIFTFSVVFAEKLIVSGTKRKQGYLSLFVAWALFLLAIILGGIGLLRLFIAGDLAHGGILNAADFLAGGHETLESYVLTVYAQLGFAGFCFVSGLLLLGVAAFFRVFDITGSGNESNTIPK